MKTIVLPLISCFMLFFQFPIKADAAQEQAALSLNLESLKALRDDFLKVAALAKVNITAKDIQIENLPAPHGSPKFSKEKMAVYIFYNDKEVLKVGKDGSEQGQRFRYQHYHPNKTNSNLAKSILKDKEFKADITLNESNISDWMKKNLSRGHFFIDKKMGSLTLNLLEAFLQSHLNPKYEGSKSQRRNKG